MRISAPAKKAALIGGLCAFSYLAVYYVRNILGAVTPKLLEGGVFSTEEIGRLSSIYFISYGVGQLVNGMIGDRVRAKAMICAGLLMAGVCNALFLVLYDLPLVAYVVYGMMGFFLAMIYAPMMKVIAENVDMIYAPRCSFLLLFASFAGSPMAGMLASFLPWSSVFAVGSATLLTMAVAVFLAFSAFERRGLVVYGQYPIRPEKSGGAAMVLIHHGIVRYAVVAIVTGIVRTTVVFWLPTFIAQHLGFAPEDATKAYTAATAVISMSSAISIVGYELLKRDMDRTMRVFFCVAVAGFFGVYMARMPLPCIVFLTIAIVGSNSAATMVFSRYCPGLRDTGLVSTATGFLDFISYAAASTSSTLFARAVDGIGWQGLILVWLALMVCGIAAVLPLPRGHGVGKSE